MGPMINEPPYPMPLKLQHAEKTITQSYPARSVLVDAGDDPEYLYRIVNGWAAQCRFLDDGKRQITSLALPGDYCDPAWIVRPTAMQSVIALTPLTVRRTSLAPFRNGDGKTMATRWWAESMRSAAMQTEWLVSLGKKSALEKLAHLFCELQTRAVGRERSRLDFPLTQTDLADICGMTSVHINRTLQQMRSMQLIELHHRQLEISDRDALERLCGFDPAYLCGNFGNVGEAAKSRAA
jgi:CRP-like cAMP-binding protein